MKINETFLILKIVFRIHLILMRIWIWILYPKWKKRIRIRVISSTYTEFFYKAEFSIFLSYLVSLIFMLKLENHSEIKIFLISLFSVVKIWVLGVNFFFSFWLIFCPLDPDRGRQNLADPNPKLVKSSLRQNYFESVLVKIKS